MIGSDRLLKLVLRLLGAGCTLGIIGVFLPTSWIATCHGYLDVGPFPGGPVFDYLARSCSALYAILGGLFLVVSPDPVRYRAVVIYLAWVFVVFGVAVLVIDLVNRLPWWWTYPEGVGTVAFGVVILILARGAATSSAERTRND